jgi:hypothetical protein
MAMNLRILITLTLITVVWTFGSRGLCFSGCEIAKYRRVNKFNSIIKNGFTKSKFMVNSDTRLFLRTANFSETLNVDQKSMAQQIWALDQQPMVVGPGVGGEEPMSLAWFTHAFQYAIFNQQTLVLLMLSNIAVFICGKSRFCEKMQTSIDGEHCFCRRGFSCSMGYKYHIPDDRYHYAHLLLRRLSSALILIQPTGTLL